MSNSTDSFNPMSLPPRELVRLLWSRRNTWMATTAACGVLAAVFSLIMPRYWEATQGLVVRQETAGSIGSRPGKFADLYEMRTLQETILEIAKSQQVVVGTIQAVDREMGVSAAAPSLEDIEKFRKRLKMLPPDGGEFGKTEVFYFSLQDTNRDRAIRLVGELCKQLEIALRDVRSNRAANLISELESEGKVAADLLGAETQRLVEFEGQVGADLGELRMLQSANSGQSDLRLEAVQLEADVRKFATDVRAGEHLLELLHAAEKDPLQLIATPNSLLESQPALRRLKDGLVDVQLAASRLSGTRSQDHPQVRAAVEAEKQIRTELHEELVSAIKGANVELQLAQGRLDAAQARLDNLQQRFEHLADLRAEYSNHLAAVDNLRVSLDHARENLSAAKASQAAAMNGSLVTRFDKPETGPYPAGVGRTVITGAGGMAGLMLGLGVVFLTAGAVVEGEGETKSPQVRQVELIRARQVAIEPANVEAPARRTAEPVVQPVAPLAPAASVSSQWWDTAPTPVVVPAAAPTTTAPTPALAPVAEVKPATSDAIERPATITKAKSTPRDTSRETPRTRREPAPSVAATLPTPAGNLPPVGSDGAFGGMSLQEALQAAARQMAN